MFWGICTLAACSLKKDRGRNPSDIIHTALNSTNRFGGFDGISERVLQLVEKQATTTDDRLPLRNVKVPGTGPRPEMAGFRPAPRDST
jgi:hypothetical protein